MYSRVESLAQARLAFKTSPAWLSWFSRSVTSDSANTCPAVTLLPHSTLTWRTCPLARKNSNSFCAGAMRPGNWSSLTTPPR